MEDRFSQAQYLEFLKRGDATGAKTYLEGSPGYMGNRVFDSTVSDTDGETTVTPTVTPVSDPETTGTTETPETTTGTTLTFEEQQALACINTGGIWDNGVCRRPGESGGATEDTGETEEPIPGSDARMPFDQYMDSLQVNTLQSQAYTDSLARRLAEIDEQQLAAGQSYEDMYQQAQMSQARRRGLSDVTGFAGGMQEQFGARMSAAELASLGQIGTARDAAIRGMELQKLNAPMDAFAEAQAIQEADRTRMLQGIEMQRSQTLFDQAQSGWRQDPETGEWTNIDKETQDMLSLQAINAQQRAETIGEMQYFQAILSDPTQAAMHEEARKNLGTLQTRYADLLLNNQATTGGPGSTTPEVDDGGGGPQPEPDLEPVNDAWETDFTKGTVKQNAKDYVASVGANLITEETDLSGFRTGIRTSEDLADGIVKLAGDKDLEGYDFMAERELVSRALNNRESITQDEFLALADAGIVRFQGNEDFKFLEFAIGTEDLSGSIRYPKTPVMETFFRKMVADGKLTEDQVAKSVGDKGYSFPKGNIEKELIAWLNAGQPASGSARATRQGVIDDTPWAGM